MENALLSSHTIGNNQTNLPERVRIVTLMKTGSRRGEMLAFLLFVINICIVNLNIVSSHDTLMTINDQIGSRSIDYSPAI